MNYVPKYTQPFTLNEAILLDVSTITQEIARLQDSIQRLESTQQTLLEYIVSESSGGSTADPEFTKAFEENRVVIGSQVERISILKMALSHKGIPYNTAHYGPTPSAPMRPAANGASTLSGPNNLDSAGGIDL